MPNYVWIVAESGYDDYSIYAICMNEDIAKREFNELKSTMLKQNFESLNDLEYKIQYPDLYENDKKSFEVFKNIEFSIDAWRPDGLGGNRYPHCTKMILIDK